jgi:uncharacterized protein (DUF58 family)
MTSPISRFILKRFAKQDHLELGHQNLFILPTRFGTWFLVTLLILFVMGTNYQNNPILLLSYFLFGIVLWSVVACFANLVGNRFEVLSVTPGYAGQAVQVQVRVIRPTDPNFCPSQVAFYVDKIPLVCKSLPGRDNVYSLHLPVYYRGRHELPLIKIQSEFPFGLIKAWSYLRAAQTLWVYPKPESGQWHFDTFESPANQRQNEQSANTANDSAIKPQQTERQFDGIKSFVPGSSMAQVAWKQYAKQPHGDLLLKDFVSEDLVPIALTLNSVHASDLENKLSVLTKVCLSLHSENRPFALSLQGFGQSSVVIAPTQNPAQGPTHLEQCLKALAQFAQPKPNEKQQDRGTP